MLDEIQAGIGRTGEWFAFQHEEILPDVLSLAKGLGNGVPIGASLVAGRARDLFTPGTHGTTFGGNPLVCRAALAVLDVMQEEAIREDAARRGADLLRMLQERLGHRPEVLEIRGRGLMLGIELDRPAGELVRTALDRGLLINVTAERVIRLLPPLIITQRQATEIADTVSDITMELLTRDERQRVTA
jgi:acetylornithine/N-succinyldiaminopimelate aminotransferase